MENKLCKIYLGFSSRGACPVRVQLKLTKLGFKNPYPDLKYLQNEAPEVTALYCYEIDGYYRYYVSYIEDYGYFREWEGPAVDPITLEDINTVGELEHFLKLQIVLKESEVKKEDTGGFKKDELDLDAYNDFMRGL